MKTLTVNLPNDHSYPILIGEDLLLQSQHWLSFIPGKQVCVVTNETVAPLYLDQVLEQLAENFTVCTVQLKDGEAFKTTDAVMHIYNVLLEHTFNRNATVIALGGGVVGDIAGFAAATYQRGVHFIQMPTTLLSQVDSSVGGKTGVNHPSGKNMIGAFYQPKVVVIDTKVLSSLPQRELSAGIAEVIKYGLIRDVNFYEWIQRNLDLIQALDPLIIQETILRSCDHKANVVSEDERESGIRAILNFGHTFGHAIETAQGYGQWLHGEAVACGMLIAMQLSADLGWIKPCEVERLKQLLLQAQLPTHAPEKMTPEQFMKLMAVDKKNISGQLRLVLLKAMGEAEICSDVSAEKITAAILATR